MEIIHDDKFIQILRSKDFGSKQVVVSFQQRLPENFFGDSNQNGFAQKFLTENKINSFFILTKSNHWYQIPRIDVAFQKIVNDHMYLKASDIVLYGQSMGGYGVLAFNKYFPNARLLSISPLAGFNKKTFQFETRWREDEAFILFQQEEVAISSCKELIVIYDKFSRDAEHIELMKLTTDCLYNLPYSGHPASVFLKETNTLSLFVLQAIKDSFDSAIVYLERAKKLRRHSQSYFINRYKAAKSIYTKRRLKTLALHYFPDSDFFNNDQ